MDDADVMVAGGSEAAICRLGIVGFAAARAVHWSTIRLKLRPVPMMIATASLWAKAAAVWSLKNMNTRNAVVPKFTPR